MPDCLLGFIPWPGCLSVLARITSSSKIRSSGFSTVGYWILNFFCSACHSLAFACILGTRPYGVLWSGLHKPWVFNAVVTLTFPCSLLEGCDTRLGTVIAEENGIQGGHGNDGNTHKVVTVSMPKLGVAEWNEEKAKGIKRNAKTVVLDVMFSPVSITLDISTANNVFVALWIWRY